MSSEFEVIIIGGGPAGSTAALALAAAGRRALIIERERFPRFHIGESLLPYNLQLFRELGLLEVIEKAGFMKKLGAQFWVSNGSQGIDVRFADGEFNAETSAFQVERSIFDNLLLREAERRGTEVREGCAVTGYVVERERVRVQTSDGEFTGRFLVDASGQANFTGNREGLRESYSNHRKVAIFGHFAGVGVGTGDKAGDIIIVRLEEGWSWLIPLSGDKVSVGIVLDSSVLRQSGRPPVEVFDEVVRGSSELRERMAGAERVGPMRTIADYSYANRRFIGRRLVRVGDAAGFMDPIFSSGVYLAMRSGREAAHAVDDALQRKAALTGRMRAYERWMRRSMKIYWRLITHFYTRPFIEVFLAPDPPRRVQAAVNSLLAGCIEPAWRVRWRLWLFYGMVRVRSKWAFTPTVNFTES